MQNSNPRVDSIGAKSLLIRVVRGDRPARTKHLLERILTAEPVPQTHFLEITVSIRGIVARMVFGIFIDVPIVVGGYFFMLRYRRQLAARLNTDKIPALAMAMLLSVPLIIVEEQINCMPSWCGTVVIPPTLTILAIEIFGLSLISLKIHAKNSFRVASLYSVFGVFVEATVGGLVGAGLLIALIFAPYVWISYGFISLLPISILLAKKPLSPNNQDTQARGQPIGPALRR